jgi:hypothetical protein
MIKKISAIKMKIIENNILYVGLLFSFLFIFYLYSKQDKVVVIQMQQSATPPPVTKTVDKEIIAIPPATCQKDPISDPYYPPLKTDDFIFSTGCPRMVNGIPINIQTQSVNSMYQQVGILTRVCENTLFKDELILPLMGRKLISNRDTWQYYTISNTGNFNTKLPIRIKGKNCIGEYGCDRIYDKDTVYVEGYSDVFRATIYENSMYQYIPF